MKTELARLIFWSSTTSSSTLFATFLEWQPGLGQVSLAHILPIISPRQLRSGKICRSCDPSRASKLVRDETPRTGKRKPAEEFSDDSSHSLPANRSESTSSSPMSSGLEPWGKNIAHAFAFLVRDYLMAEDGLGCELAYGAEEQ